MKKLLSWNNFVAVSEGDNGTYDLEFDADGLQVVIRGAEMQGRPLIDGVIQHPLKYWYEKKNIELAIEQAELEEIEVIDLMESVKTNDDLLEEISDITQELDNTIARLVHRLDKMAFVLKQQG